MPNQARLQNNHTWHEDQSRLLARQPTLSAGPVQVPPFDRHILAEWDVVRPYRFSGAVRQPQAKGVSPIRGRILCIGDDEVVLKYRCAVLISCGYRAQAATVAEACRQVHTERFSLVIVSPMEAKANNDFLASLPTETKTLVLNGLIFPRELLAAVSDRLPDGRRGITVVQG